MRPWYHHGGVLFGRLENDTGRNANSYFITRTDLNLRGIISFYWCDSEVQISAANIEHQRPPTHSWPADVT